MSSSLSNLSPAMQAFLLGGGKVTKLPAAKPASNRTFKKVRNARLLRAKPQV
jgi:hypothetical protein